MGFVAFCMLRIFEIKRRKPSGLPESELQFANQKTFIPNKL